MRRTGMAAALLVAPASAMAVNMKCIDRDGRCIEVTVNGQKNVKLSKPTKKLMLELERTGSREVSDWVRDVKYELLAPIQGELQVTAEQTTKAGDWFGADRQAEVRVIPLDDVELQARAEITAADDVRVGGAAPLVQRHVLEQNTLPPGRYLLAVTLRGRDNWDRQVLYFTVK
jgi:hypothetical protein